MNEDLVLLTKTIIEKIITDKEALSVKEFENDEDIVQIEVTVNEEDLSKVIGKDGKTIKAIRTIVQASATLNNNRRCKINVDSY